jgi:regulator of protease activity HflC (stomatin/prohibitin superfamily)
MDAAIWISLLVGLAIALFVVWVVLLETSFIVEPGTLALVLKRGKATERAAEPGRHFIQPWRKATIQVYPSRELALIAGGRAAVDARVEFSDDPLRVHLGDKACADVSYTVRCQIDPSRLRDIHEQYGPDGVWSALRDATRGALLTELSGEGLSVDDVYGAAYVALEQRLAGALERALADVGFRMKLFTLRQIDLGETGKVIQATVRTDAELVREQSLTALRRARLENDAEIVAAFGVDSEMALRYRQIETWQDIVHRWDGDRPIPAALTTPLGQQPTVDHHIDEHLDAAVADEPAQPDDAP